MSDTTTAVIAASAVLLGAFLTSFVAEDYRRFRDSSALAAAFAGELASYELGLRAGKTVVSSLVKILEAGTDMTMPKPQAAIDAVFDANIDRIGSLGSNLTEDLVFAYHQIRAYRTAQTMAQGATDIHLRLSSLRVALTFLDNALDVVPSVVTRLRSHGSRGWVPFRR